MAFAGACNGQQYGSAWAAVGRWFGASGVRLVRSEHHTDCPFKGQASYYSLEDGPDNAVWTYEQPYDEMLAIKDHLPEESEQERAALDAVNTFQSDGFGYFLEQSTRPQTIGYSLLDSPIGLAAWMLDHDTDSYYKISRAFVAGEPVGGLTRESIVDNITLYWLTGTAASAARSYWEDARALAAALASRQPPPAVKVPVGFTTFPGEIWASPRSWVEAVYPDLAYFNEVDRGGHFAAWEEPELFTTDERLKLLSFTGSPSLVVGGLKMWAARTVCLPGFRSRGLICSRPAISPLRIHVPSSVSFNRRGSDPGFSSELR